MEIYGTLQPKNNINGGINVASIGGGGGTSDFDTKIIPYDNRIKANEQNIETLQSDISEQFDDVNVAIENHTEQISTLADNVTYLETEVDTNTQNISNLSTSINNVNQTVSNLSSDVAQNSADIENIKEHIIEGYSTELLYDGFLKPSASNQTLILPKSIENFDALVFSVWSNTTGTIGEMLVHSTIYKEEFYTKNDYENNLPLSHMVGDRYEFRGIQFDIVNSTTIVFYVPGGGRGALKSIRGIKF